MQIVNRISHRWAFVVILCALTTCSEELSYPVYDEGEIIWQATENPDSEGILDFLITPDEQNVIVIGKTHEKLALAKYDLANRIEWLVPNVGWYPDISPDGKWLAFAGRGLNGNQNIFKIKLNGDSLSELQSQVAPGFEYSSSYPKWHPDGRLIVHRNYNKNRDSTGLYILNEDNSVEFITSFVGGDFDFFPDGKRLIMTEDFRFIIYNLETKEKHYIGNASNQYLELLEVSPDGSQILFFNGYGTFVMNSDGSNERLVIPSSSLIPFIGNLYGFTASDPSWHRDGKHIVFKHLVVTGYRCAYGNPGAYTCSYPYFGLASIRKIKVPD